MGWISHFQESILWQVFIMVLVSLQLLNTLQSSELDNSWLFTLQKNAAQDPKERNTVRELVIKLPGYISMKAGWRPGPLFFLYLHIQSYRHFFRIKNTFPNAYKLNTLQQHICSWMNGSVGRIWWPMAYPRLKNVPQAESRDLKCIK